MQRINKQTNIKNLKTTSLLITLLLLLGATPIAFAAYSGERFGDGVGLIGDNLGDNPDVDALELLIQNGEYQQAINHWRVEYRAYRDSQNLSGQIIALYKIATTQRLMGLHNQAIRALEVAHKLLSLEKNENLSVAIKANLAGAYLYSGRLDDAKHLFGEARNLAIKNNKADLLALINNDLGNYYALSKLPEQAVQAYEKSIEISLGINDDLQVARTAANAMLLQINQHHEQNASEYLVKAQQSIVKVAPSYRKTRAVLKLAEASIRLVPHNTEQTQNALTNMVQLLAGERDFAEKIQHDRLSAHTNKVMADYYEATGQYDDALVLAKKSMFHAQVVDAADLLYQLEWQVGRIHRHLSHPEQAIGFYQRAINTLQPIRPQLARSSVAGQADFEASQGNIYLELADLLLSKASRSTASEEVSQLLLEARLTVEQEKTAELQDYFKDSCVVDAQSQVKSVDDTIDAGTAIIYPILLPDRTELLISYATGIKQYVVDQTNAEITAQVRQLRVKLEKRRSRDYLPYAKNLYKALIAPIEPDLKQRNITTLVIIPGQALRTIPLSVLHDGEQFLINKYALATTPGLTLTDPRPLKRQKMKILLSGLSEPVQGFPPLDYVRGELEQIKDLYISKLLLNNDFITNSISSELQDAEYSVAHFASHAEFTGDVKDSYILTFDNRLTVNELGQFASLSQYRKKPIELLTLSACNTAAGDDRAALGLAGVAVKSGARSALASLWAINDKASSLLVTEFYRQLLDENVTKAVALQRAQEKLMKNIRYRHPGYWSPFLLIGNWL